MIFSYSSCSNDYDSILEGLTKNYVLLSDEIENDLYLEYFKLTEKEHLEDLAEYNKAVKNFYNSDKGIVGYLLNYENDTIQLCKWIKTKNPYSSNIDEMDLMTNSKGVLILIDNYLSNSNGTIRIPSYMNDLSYEKLKTFYDENKGLTRDELKNLYVKVLHR